MVNIDYNHLNTVYSHSIYAAEKYKNRVFKCKLCGWAYSNKYAKKAKEHAEECPAIWIYQDWKPQKLETLKLIKS